MKYVQGRDQDFHWGQDRMAEGRERGWGSWEGSNLLPTGYGSGERCELPQQDSGRSPDRFLLFSALRMAAFQVLEVLVRSFTPS